MGLLPAPDRPRPRPRRGRRCRRRCCAPGGTARCSTARRPPCAPGCSPSPATSSSTSGAPAGPAARSPSPTCPRATAPTTSTDQLLLSWVVAEALTRLSPEHRAVLLECYYRGRPVAEAAARLGVPEGTVKSRTHYALRALRLALEEMGVGRMSCEFAHQDGAYVLGALSPAERREFEQHLAGCDECARRCASSPACPACWPGRPRRPGGPRRRRAGARHAAARPGPRRTTGAAPSHPGHRRPRRGRGRRGGRGAAGGRPGCSRATAARRRRRSASAAPRSAMVPVGDAPVPGEPRVRVRHLGHPARPDLHLRAPRGAVPPPAPPGDLRAGRAHPGRPHRAGRHLAVAGGPHDAADRGDGLAARTRSPQWRCARRKDGRSWS